MTNIETVVQEILQHLDEIKRVSPVSHEHLRGKWDRELRAELRGYKVVNFTSFNYDKSINYCIWIRPGLFDFSMFTQRPNVEVEGEYVLGLYMSVILPYYLVYCGYSKHVKGSPPTFTLSEPQTDRQKDVVRRVEKFADNHGFEKLPIEYARVVIPDIELSLAKRGDVTVFHCLFADAHYYVGP